MTFQDFIDCVSEPPSTIEFLGHLYVIERVEHGISAGTGLRYQRVKVKPVFRIGEPIPDFDIDYSFWMTPHMWEHCNKNLDTGEL